MGPACSVASAGMVRTPLGNAVLLRPSRAGRAPVPPLLNMRISRGGSPADGSTARALTWKFQRAPAPSAGTTSGSASAMAPRHRSVTKCPITWRTATGSGWRALRMQPSGALTEKAAREAWLDGISGARATSMAYEK